MLDSFDPNVAIFIVAAFSTTSRFISFANKSFMKVNWLPESNMTSFLDSSTFSVCDSRALTTSKLQGRWVITMFWREKMTRLSVGVPGLPFWRPFLEFDLEFRLSLEFLEFDRLLCWFDCWLFLAGERDRFCSLSLLLLLGRIWFWFWLFRRFWSALKFWLKRWPWLNWRPWLVSLLCCNPWDCVVLSLSLPLYGPGFFVPLLQIDEWCLPPHLAQLLLLHAATVWFAARQLKQRFFDWIICLLTSVDENFLQFGARWFVIPQ